MRLFWKRLLACIALILLVAMFGAYTLVNIWQNNQWCGYAPSAACYEVRDPLDLAIVAAAITGACASAILDLKPLLARFDVLRLEGKGDQPGGRPEGSPRPLSPDGMDAE